MIKTKGSYRLKLDWLNEYEYDYEVPQQIWHGLTGATYMGGTGFQHGR